MPTLVALFGPKRGVRLALEGTLVLGRSAEAGLQLVDGKVSREHCRLTVTDTGVVLEDLGSQNGSYLNGERITGQRQLNAGDEIAIGDSLFVFDGDLDVASARFGDATVVVVPGQALDPDAAPTGLSGLLAEQAARLAGRLRAAEGADERWSALLDAVDAVLAPDRAFVFLGGHAGAPVRPLAGRVKGGAGDTVIAVSRTLLALAAERGRGVAVEDAAGDRALGKARSVVKHGLRRVVLSPLPGAAGQPPIGFVQADRAGRGGYGPEHAAALDVLAAVATVSEGAAGARVGAGKRARGEPARDPVGVSRAWAQAIDTATAAARTDSTVLITGESGTGKEEIARLIAGRGARATGPFVAVNCGAIAESLAESELFGHDKGAFSGAIATREGRIEAADGGTLFLDEVGELSPALQVKLLRVLQERAFSRVGETVARTVDIRVIAATHRDLEADIKNGRFRADLFYRLDVIRVRLPPLRDRPEDVGPLAEALLGRIAARLGQGNPGLNAAAKGLLCKARWPGNARELGNVLERALVLRSPDAAGPLDAAEVATAMPPGDASEGAAIAGTLAEKVEALERAEITTAMRAARGVKTHAAERLGISRPTLDKKLSDLKIDLWKQD